MLGVIPVREVFVVMAIPNQRLIPIPSERSILCLVALVIQIGVGFIEYNFVGIVRIVITVTCRQ